MTNKKNFDTDPQETRDWLESIKSLIDSSGPIRAHYILENLISYARRNGVRMPYTPYTDYINRTVWHKET